MSDLFGRKSALLFAYFTFGLGCLLCGLSRNLKELVAARAFAGESEPRCFGENANGPRHWRRRYDDRGVYSDQ
jgi:hypothetical protein